MLDYDPTALPIEDMADRLSAHYQAAPAGVRRAGRAWYPAAAGFADELAECADTDRLTSAAVISALSPRVRWPANKLAATALMAGRPRPAGIISRFWGDGLRALHDGPETLTGRKRRDFRDCIDNPRARTAVIDIWMLRAIHGRRLTDRQVKQATERVGAYDLHRDAVLEAAARHRVPAPAFQATVWLQVRDGGQ